MTAWVQARGELGISRRMDPSRKLRVLLIAEAANPEWTSVPLVGWSHARALMDLVDGHLVTQVRNGPSILRTGLHEGKQLTTLDSEVIARPLWQTTDFIRKVTGLGWTFDTAMQVLPYYWFETLLWRRFGRAITEGKFDVVHRLTPLSPTIPSLIAGRCARAGVPFVWGPINGGVPWPPGFGHVQRREGEWLHAVRDVYRLLPGYGETRTHSAAIIAGSRATLEQLPPEARRRAVYLPENAIDPERFPRAREGAVSTPLKVAFVGRLVAYKGADMLLEAAAPLVRAGRMVVDIIGDGPERSTLIALAAELGCANGVRLEGWVEHRALGERLLEADVFAFPSVREFGGGVVLEAMALGLVPVVADYGGPAELVTEETGYRVPMGSRRELIARFRAALEKLVEDGSGLREMGARGRARVQELFTWEAKAHQTREIYRWVLGERERPDFGMPLGENVPSGREGQRDSEAAFRMSM
jgi:alpha-maltose-1-phosphate synthase